MNPAALPDPVQQQLQEHPECNVSIESSLRMMFMNGKGSEESSKNYYLQCPGKRRQLIHSESKSVPRGSENEERGGSAWSQMFDGQRTDGQAPAGTPGGGPPVLGLPDVDDFLRDFFGIPADRQGMQGRNGRHPFPFPLPGPQDWPWAGGRGIGGGNGDAADDGRQRLPAPHAEQPQHQRIPSIAERERGRGIII